MSRSAQAGSHEPAGDRNVAGILRAAVDRPLEYFGDLVGGPVIAAARPAKRGIEGRHTEIVHDVDFRAVLDQVIVDPGPGLLHRAE